MAENQNEENSKGQADKQEPLMKSSKTAEVLPTILFATESVKRLREQDFSLNSKEKIGITFDDCMLVLFYVDNMESQHVAQIWAEAAAQISGPIFAACHMNSERKVAEAFTALNMDNNHPFHKFALKQYPFIIVYRKGWPKAFYNGDRTTQEFIDFAMTLACSADYVEQDQIGAGFEAENRWETSKYKPYEKGSDRKLSTEYTSNAPMRGYNPTLGNVVKGSKEEAKEEQQLKESGNVKKEGDVEGKEKAEEEVKEVENTKKPTRNIIDKNKNAEEKVEEIPSAANDEKLPVNINNENKKTVGKKV